MVSSVAADIINGARELPREIKAKTTNRPLIDTCRDIRIGAAAGVKRWSAVDDFALHALTLYPNAHHGRLAEAITMADQVGEKFVENKTDMMDGPRINPLALQKIGRLFREPADRGSRHGYFGLDMHDRLLRTIQREQNGSGVVECRVAVFKCADKSNELRERFLHLWHEAGKKFLDPLLAIEFA
jgi:hypothetical protein